MAHLSLEHSAPSGSLWLPSGQNRRSQHRTDVRAVKSVRSALRYSDVQPVTTLIGAAIAPQRPKYVREKTEPDRHILEPEWAGTRALVRLGHPGDRFVGYAGPVEGPRELYDAIGALARCRTAIIDGVLVPDWQDEPELEADRDGNAFTRPPTGRRIFAAFDLLEVDGEALIGIPLLERKRQLEGLLQQSVNVRLTAYASRGLRAWRDTLQTQGFRRVVLKSWNSTYAPGQSNDDWVVTDKLNPPRPS